MSQQDDINATAAQEEQDIASIQASQASFAATASSLNDEIQALQQQIASNPTQPVSALDFTSIAQASSDLHNAAQALASAATTEASSVPSAPTPTPTPAPTPEPTPTPTPTQDATPNQPVYVYSGGDTPADPAWTPAPFLTTDGRQLYYFASDSPGSAPNGNGAGGVWQVYDVSQGVQAAPAAPVPSNDPTTDPGAPTNEPSPPTA